MKLNPPEFSRNDFLSLEHNEVWKSFLRFKGGMEMEALEKLVEIQDPAEVLIQQAIVKTLRRLDNWMKEELTKIQMMSEMDEVEKVEVFGNV